MVNKDEINSWRDNKVENLPSFSISQSFIEVEYLTSSTKKSLICYKTRFFQAIVIYYFNPKAYIYIKNNA